jgi:hypothetical protein
MILDSARLQQKSPDRMMTVMSFAGGRLGQRGRIIPSAQATGVDASLRLPPPTRSIPGIPLGVR